MAAVRTFSLSDFDTFLDKAVDPLQLEFDTDAMYDISCYIEQGRVELEQAIHCINNKLIDKNPHTVNYALEVLKFVFFTTGKKMHEIINTSKYMDFLKNIIDTTNQKLIKNKIISILEEWANIVKYMPTYNEPQKLLNSLKVNSEISQNVNTKTLNVINDLKNSKQSSIDIDSNISLNHEKTQILFDNELKEIQENKRIQYKFHKKSLGETTSSDEDDTPLENQESGACGTSVEDKESKPSVEKEVSNELDAAYEERLRLDANLSSVRFEEHELYRRNANSIKLQRCPINCTHCANYNRKSTEIVSVTKHLPPELQKVKDSKIQLAKDFKDVQKIKMQNYYRRRKLQSLQS